MSTIRSIIESRGREITQRWADEAERAASVRGLSRPSLMNIMPKYIASLANVDHSTPDDDEQRKQLFERHVASRIREGFRLDEMIEELAILGRIVLDEDRSRPDSERLGTDAIELLREELHRATETLAVSITRHMTDDEQVEKRYLRRLQGIDTETPESNDAEQFAPRMRSLLAIVMDALEVTTAALLFINPRDADRRVLVTEGPLRAELQQYLESDRLPTTRSLSADEGEPTTTIPIDDALRSAGVRTLVGTRLPRRDRVHGALFLAMDRPEISLREIDRLELLAETVAVQLDSASLLSQLRATIEEMSVEKGLRERFVSILMHDLRGPLASARINAQLLVRDDDRRRDAVAGAARVVTSIDRADRMVRDLLDMLRIRAGMPLPLEVTECDLVRIAHSVADETRSAHAPPVEVRGDATAIGRWSEDDLRRALWNLVKNAQKYGDHTSPVVITVTADAAHATVSVHNEGEPSAPEDQSRLFTPFAQILSARDGKRGWGLGLTLVQGAVAAHGGEIRVTSERGRGTTFTLVLPRFVTAARPNVTDPT